MEEEVIDRGDDFEELEEELEDVNSEEDQEEDQEEETEEETEEDQEEEEIEEETKSSKEPRIPKYRFDEVIQQREDAKERNLWLEAQLEKLINSQQAKEEPVKKVRESFDFEKSEEDYIALVIDGEVAKAAKLRSQINEARKEELLEMMESVKASSSNKAKEESLYAVERERFSMLVKNMENKYKFLDFKNKNYNEEAVETINTLLKGYVSSGKSRTEGLKIAIKKVLPMYVKDETTQIKESLGDQRRVDAGKKAASASKSQPIKTKSANTNSDSGVVNISKLSDKDFRSLSDREKRILRGD